jgi:glycosyltransferase involved in cell wall biosynthesis
MKILVATDQWSPDVIGGSARVATDTAHALGARGHEIVVLAPSGQGMPAVEHDGPVEVRRILRRGPFPQTLSDPVLTLRGARRLRNRSFDVVLAHQATGACGLLAARLGAPLALVFHASAVLEMRFLRRHLAGVRRAALHTLDPVLAALERVATGRAGTILVLSEFSAGLVRGRHPSIADRIELVGGGVDDTFFDPPPGAGARRASLGIPPGILLFTARRLEPRMGLDVLIDALPLVRDDRVVLAVAGTGSARGQIERRIGQLGLQNRVRLLGRVSETDLRALYATADLFIMPTVAYEGFGMATVEALAAGTPVLGTAVGATPEIIRSLGSEFVVPEAEPRMLASALRDVLPLLGPDLRLRARRLAEDRYRWQRTIVRWEKALLGLTRVDEKESAANL